ncbi:MAG: Crp/Fnr family transcriptional regulator [Ruminococcaceae bacterium]|nr:Crp/Fnr family transcriptional regulator [Oscillospiraceae bacterium]
MGQTLPKIDYDALLEIPLFKGLGRADVPALLSCVGARPASYARGDFLLMEGDAANAIGVVLHGCVQVLKEDVFGNRAIINELEAGAVFGESFVCGGSYMLSVSVQAVEDSTVLFMDFDRVMNSCTRACEFHGLLVRNMVRLIARKNVNLMEKLEVVTKRTLRERVLAYLSQLSQAQGGGWVTSPLGRVDLADYLGVDRSALTRELNKMREDELIVFEKNRYRLLNV